MKIDNIDTNILVANNWKDYELIDAGSGERLERWKDIILIRPDPQAIWGRSDHKLWDSADAIYFRSSAGGGEWRYKDESSMPSSWFLTYRGLKFKVKPTGFKHTGLFPEQAVNWDYIMDKTKQDNIKETLNLFGYTGAASLAAAAGGSKVCHLDASKGAVNWCKENSHASKISEDKIRFIVDDALKFVKREVKRNKKYDAIIMDPPTFGRGANSEIWRLQDSLWELLSACKEILSDNKSYILINSYTASLSAIALYNTVYEAFSDIIDNKTILKVGEIALPFRGNTFLMPCGVYCRLEFR